MLEGAQHFPVFLTVPEVPSAPAPPMIITQDAGPCGRIATYTMVL